jgi:hypothetical protein
MYIKVAHPNTRLPGAPTNKVLLARSACLRGDLPSPVIHVACHSCPSKESDDVLIKDRLLSNWGFVEVCAAGAPDEFSRISPREEVSGLENHSDN